MIRTLANIIGLLLLMIGVLGFLPVVTSHGLLLKTFQVNTGLNLLHLFSGAAALWCGLSSALAARIYFRFFGAVYLVVAFIGFCVGRALIFHRFSNNTADSWVHLGLAVLFLILGLGRTQEPAISQFI